LVEEAHLPNQELLDKHLTEAAVEAAEDTQEDSEQDLLGHQDKDMMAAQQEPLVMAEAEELALLEEMDSRQIVLLQDKAAVQAQ
jgi:hypothetical protein